MLVAQVCAWCSRICVGCRDSPLSLWAQGDGLIVYTVLNGVDAVFVCVSSDRCGLGQSAMISLPNLVDAIECFYELVRELPAPF